MRLLRPSHWPRNVREQYCRRCNSNSREFSLLFLIIKKQKCISISRVALPTELLGKLYYVRQDCRKVIISLLFADNWRFLARGQKKRNQQLRIPLKRHFRRDSELFLDTISIFPQNIKLLLVIRRFKAIRRS